MTRRRTNIRMMERKMIKVRRIKVRRKSNRRNPGNRRFRSLESRFNLRNRVEVQATK
jgi:hypothetical protein